MGISTTWHRMMAIKEVAESAMLWLIGKGSINFWWDRWFKDFQFGDGIQVPPNLQKLTVKEALSTNFDWETFVDNHFDCSMVQEIKRMRNLLCDIEDKCVWTGCSNGVFSIKSAWQKCRHASCTSGIS